jgi:hypothetical protein
MRPEEFKVVRMPGLVDFLLVYLPFRTIDPKPVP